MARRDEVKHQGKVVAKDPQMTTVRIVSQSACASCHAKGLCGLAEAVEKAVRVPTDPHARYGVGDEVEVVLKASMGMKAVFLAYFLPLVVLLAVILGLIALGVAEMPAGLAGIGAVGVYYFCLWLLRDSLHNEYIFTIKE
ncbi:MAG: SoxR reducing system RseC family protein [Bacteroidales bacterium]|nr:SoxR reducing system RseC family protein [Bacteroidales bacterium]MBR1706494.1 SoxR reducing system RseC family protein [Bacteroidales bacterium]